jgi:hypothetical protein
MPGRQWQDEMVAVKSFQGGKVRKKKGKGAQLWPQSSVLAVNGLLGIQCHERRLQHCWPFVWSSPLPMMAALPIFRRVNEHPGQFSVSGHPR